MYLYSSGFYPPPSSCAYGLNQKETYDAYVFANIRFAAPPIGALRFGPPQPPLVDRSEIRDGSVGFACPAALSGSSVLPPGYEIPQSEDCLFLDVIVPRKVLAGQLGQVPVLFWCAIHPLLYR